MAPWHFGRVDYFAKGVPLFLGLGTLLPLFISMWRKDVSPYVPWISEAAATAPSSYVFGVFINVTSFFGCSCVILRSILIEIRNAQKRKSIHTWNVFSAVMGLLGMIGMTIVTVCNMIEASVPHYIGAAFVLVGNWIYLMVQTVFDFQFYHTHISSFMLRLRLALTATATFALSFLLAISFSIHNHTSGSELWSGKKLPGHEGFVMYVIGSIFEWLQVMCHGIYFSTLVVEFKNVSILVKENLTSCHHNSNGYVKNKDF